MGKRSARETLQHFLRAGPAVVAALQHVGHQHHELRRQSDEWRLKPWCSQRKTEVGQFLKLIHGQLRESEVRQPQRAIGSKQNVARLHVAMDIAANM